MSQTGLVVCVGLAGIAHHNLQARLQCWDRKIEISITRRSYKEAGGEVGVFGPQRFFQMAHVGHDLIARLDLQSSGNRVPKVDAESGQGSVLFHNARWSNDCRHPKLGRLALSRGDRRTGGLRIGGSREGSGDDRDRQNKKCFLQ